MRLLAAVLALVTAACTNTSAVASGGGGRTPTSSPSPTPSKADAILAGMSTEEKAGQLFMPVLYGPKASGRHQGNPGGRSPAATVKKYRLGGAIYFDWAQNVRSAKQVAALSNGLQKAAETPMLISADQETGLVARLDKIATTMPGNMATGATGDAALSRAAAKVIGAELKSLGISLDLAPVADVNANPRNPVIGVRSYGSVPERVAEMTGAAVDGFHDAGVAAAAKHFPGHGDTATDSHTGLPVIENSREKWQRQDRPPFDTAIQHGTDAILSAHIVMPALDPKKRPATLSKPILTGILREEMGFKGVVITDGLQMAAVRKKHSDGEVAVRAIEAGADILLMPPDLPEAHKAVLKAIRSERISAERLDESVRRILRLKETRGVLDAEPATGEGLRSAAHREVAQQVADKAVTSMGGPPARFRRGDRVNVTGSPALAKELRKQGLTVTSGASTLIAVTSTGTVPVAGKRVVGVSTGTPYRLAEQKGLAGRLAAYSPSTASMRAVARVLTGDLDADGRSPVERD